MPDPHHLSRRRLLRLLVAGPLLAACGAGTPSPTSTRVYFEAPTRQPTATAGASPTRPAPAATAAPAAVRASGTPTTAVRAGGTPPAATPAASQSLGGASLPPDPGRRAGANLFPAGTPRAIPAFARRPAPVGLTIPRLDLTARIVSIGTRLDKDGNLVWETAAFAVGHHQGSANPGEAGNVVLSGHISSVSEGAVFAKLPAAKLGDGVVVRTPDRDHLYTVTSVQTVLPTDVHVLDPSDEYRLILITCVPDRVYTHRLIVTATQV